MPGSKNNVFKVSSVFIIAYEIQCKKKSEKDAENDAVSHWIKWEQKIQENPERMII